MANNNVQNGVDAPLSSESAAKLIGFKELLNKEIAKIFPNVDLKILENDNTNDYSFTDLLDSVVLNSSQQTAYPELKVLAEKYNNLPDEITSPRSLQKTFFAKPSENISAGMQSQETINLAQNYLDIEETKDGNVNEVTSRAIRSKLHELQNNNPDINVEFSPEKNDARTVNFLNELVKKNMTEAGVNGADLHQTLIQLWALEQSGVSVNNEAYNNLSESASLLNVMSLITSGALASGISTYRPQISSPWDKGWTDDSSPDRFFSHQTYDSLLNSKAVTAETLFAENSANPNGALLKKIAANIGLDTNKELYSQADVGRLAIEVMVFQAKELCIDEKDIQAAIHSGEFMPHIDDVFLADQGFGFPPELQDEVEARGAELEYQIQFEEHRREIIRHRGAAFAERFGDLPQAAIEKMIPFYDKMLEEPEKTAFIKSEFSSPAMYFRSGRGATGIQEQSAYEKMRDNVYLPRLEVLHGDGKIGICSAPKPDSECTVESATEYDCGIKEPEPAPLPIEECTVESATEYNCGKDFSSNAGGSEKAADAIAANMQDTTGQQENPDDTTKYNPALSNTADITPAQASV